MLLFLVFALAFLLGLLSALTPGLHSNTIIAVLSSFHLEGPEAAIAITVLFATHLLVSYVPSIFFNIPDSGSAVSVLAGPALVRRGQGMVALQAVLISGAFAALLGLALFLPSLTIFPIIYGFLRPYLGWILLAFTVVLLVRSQSPVRSFAIFLTAGLLGVYALNLAVFDPFLPLFSGFFAMAAILTYQRGVLPPQADSPAPPSVFRFSVLGVAGGFLADLLPGISSASQVAVLLSVFMPMDSIGYLASVASISVSSALFSFATMASIGKARVGATAWLSRVIDIGPNLLFIVVVFAAAVALTSIVLYRLRRPLASLARMDFTHFNRLLVLYLLAMIVLLDGWAGLLVFIVASALGYLCLLVGVERRNLMGAVILPTLLLLFGIYI